MGMTVSTESPHHDRSFRQFVDAHQAEVLRYLRRLTGNAAEAENLFQETFVRALPGFPRLRANSNHWAWVYRIATNVFLNHRRSIRRCEEVPLGGDFRTRQAQHDAALTKTAYRRDVARLPPRQRTAFIQRIVMGCSYQEIAAAMGGTQTAARAHVSQALRRLRQRLIDPGAKR